MTKQEREQVIDECRRQVWARIRWGHGSDEYAQRLKAIVDRALDDLKLFEFEETDILRQSARILEYPQLAQPKE